MGAEPLVSVVIPTHNRAHLLRDTLDSVARQTYGNFECIVVDDSSTDCTRQVVEDYVQTDSRFCYYSVKHRSASRSRNEGISRASGEWISFLDDDDLYAQDKLEWQIEEALANPRVVMVYGDALHFRGNDPTRGKIYLSSLRRKPQGDAFEALLSCSSIYSPLVKATAIREAGGFDVSLPFAEDWDMWIRVSRQGRTVYQPRTAIHYRVHEGNRSAYALFEYRWARRVVHKNTKDLSALKRMEIRRRARRYFQRGYAPRLYEAACAATFGNRWSEARQNWRALLWLDPRRAMYYPAIINALWSLLPDVPPLWRRSHSS